MRYSEAAWIEFATAGHLPDDARFKVQAPVVPRPPILAEKALRHIVASLTIDELKKCLKTRLLPLSDTTFAACGKQAMLAAERAGIVSAAIVHPADFLEAVRLVWGEELKDEATHQLFREAAQCSAKRRLSLAQTAMVLFSAAILASGLLAGFGLLLLQIALLFGALLFLAAVAVRVLVLLPGEWRNEISPTALADEDLPTYSVLVPLFRETRVVDRLLGALADIDYPRDRLDIKILVEEFDTSMRTALAEYRWPQHFEILVVPAGELQTKPRALCYGLLFARGDLVTIYDAEDIPSPTQLRLCAAAFAKAPQMLACLQARLTIYNANENWLTRQFALEYASLFGAILPGLAGLGLPLPLGGTSNHFRISCLRKAGGWDPYNVTEDADLGIRLARLGYKTATIDSDTFEEACIGYRDWNRQRARWLKGFLQTWLVHMRNPRFTWRELGAGGFAVFQAVTVGVVVSALLHPLLLAYAIWSFADIAGKPHSLLHYSTWLEGFGLMILVAGYGASFWIAIRTIRRQALTALWSSILTLPGYWLLLTPAAWLALWQFATDPHGWNKTPHGLSRLLD